MVNKHGNTVNRSPKYGFSPSKWPNSMAEINGGDPITTYKSWDDPPSRSISFQFFWSLTDLCASFSSGCAS